MEVNDFWESEEYFGFRLNKSNYGEHFKFRAWLEHEVEKRKSEKSYDEKIT